MCYAARRRALPIQIPEEDREAIEKLVDLSPEETSRLIDALRQVPPTLSSRRLAVQVADRTGLDKQMTRDIIRVLRGMYGVRAALDPRGLDEVVEGICTAVEA